MHECVLTHDLERRSGVTTLDLAKRLLDFGVHPPTIYFPLVVHGALMIEPTETESRETLDDFVEVMERVYREAVDDPELVKTAPHSTSGGAGRRSHRSPQANPALDAAEVNPPAWRGQRAWLESRVICFVVSMSWFVIPARGCRARNLEVSGVRRAALGSGSGIPHAAATRGNDKPES